MKKIVYGMGLIALLSVGIGYAITQEQEKLFDEKLIQPLIDIVEKDTKNKLAVLAKHRAYLDKTETISYPQAMLLEQEEQELIKRIKDAQKYADIISVNKEIDTLEKQKAEINRELDAYYIRDELDSKINYYTNYLIDRRDNPIRYVADLFHYVDLEYLLKPYRAQLLQGYQKKQEEKDAAIKNIPEEEFQDLTAGLSALATNDELLQKLLVSKASELSINLVNTVEGKNKRAVYSALDEYINKIEKGQQTIAYRLKKLKEEKAGPFFSLLEQTYAPSWFNLTNWLSNQWQKMKMYGNQFKQAWQQGARYSMTPAGEYELRRYELGREEPRPLRTDYGIVADWKARMQPYTQRMYQRWEPTVERMQRQVETMKPQLGKDTYSDYFSKIRGGYYGLD